MLKRSFDTQTHTWWFSTSVGGIFKGKPITCLLVPGSCLLLKCPFSSLAVTTCSSSRCTSNTKVLNSLWRFTGQLKEQTSAWSPQRATDDPEMSSLTLWGFGLHPRSTSWKTAARGLSMQDAVRRGACVGFLTRTTCCRTRTVPC